MRRTTGTDDTLASRAAQGDAAAFGELVKRHRPWVCRTLRAFAQDPSAAEDLAQETFTRLFQSLGRYQSRGQLTALIQRIAVNVGRSHLKSTGRTSFVSWDDVAEPLGGDVAEEALGRFVKAELRAALDALPPDQRDALLLRFVAGKTVPEIARQLGCAEGTIKSRLHYGLLKVRTTLEETRKEDTP